ATVIFCLTMATDLSVRRLTMQVSEKSSQRIAVLESGRRNAEALRALGMVGRVAERWAAINRAYEDSPAKVLERSGGFAALARVFRMMFQSGVLGVGAFLVIAQPAS